MIIRPVVLNVKREMSAISLLATTLLAFGALLKQLRKHAAMTQGNLVALGYSDSFISRLEQGQSQLDLDAVIDRFIPALGLHDDSTTAALLIERAESARGKRLITSTI